jgi:hypothetical protein
MSSLNCKRYSEDYVSVELLTIYREFLDKAIEAAGGPDALGIKARDFHSPESVEDSYKMLGEMRKSLDDARAGRLTPLTEQFHVPREEMLAAMKAAFNIQEGLIPEGALKQAESLGEITTVFTEALRKEGRILSKDEEEARLKVFMETVERRLGGDTGRGR